MATFDLTTDAGQVRFWIPDIGTETDTPPTVTDTRYADDQIDYFLTQAGLDSAGNARIFLAVALTLDQWANEMATTAVNEKVAVLAEDRRQTWEAIVSRAAWMRQRDLETADFGDGVGNSVGIAVSATSDRFPRFTDSHDAIGTNTSPTQALDTW